MIQNREDTPPVEEPDSTDSTDAVDIVDFRYTVVEEKFIVDGSFDASAVVLEIITSFRFVVVSKLGEVVSDEDPNSTAGVVNDEFVPKGNINVLLVPNWSVTKLVVLDVVPAISEGIPSDKALEDPNPAAVGVLDDDEMTPWEDVLMLPNCSVTKLLVLELVL